MGKYNENSKIKELMEDEEAKAIIEKHLPTITKHPMISLGYGYTLEKAFGYRMFIGLSAEKEALIKKELFELE